MAIPQQNMVLDESQAVRGAVAGDERAIREIVRRHNRRLFRIARSIVRDDGDAEDVLQEAYLKAFAALGSFRGEAQLGTWLARIVINEALQRVRRKIDKPEGARRMEDLSAHTVIAFPGPPADPERIVGQRQILHLVERAIDSLPDAFRTVLVARLVEGLSVEETADLLKLRAETVRTRLHRARGLLQKSLASQIDPVLGGAFPFDGWRCDRMADAVVARLKAVSTGNL